MPPDATDSPCAPGAAVLPGVGAGSPPAGLTGARRVAVHRPAGHTPTSDVWAPAPVATVTAPPPPAPA
ncbi:3-carboxy-cis,cis-muconate cycloisomerase, partial [Streptomyces hydrogenans]